MLTDAPLRALLAGGESDRVEFTTALKNTAKFGEAVCAFANDFPDQRQPGYLLLGVNDKGKPSGLTVTDALLRRLGELRSNVNLEPLPAMTVGKRILPEGEVAVVEVMPSDLLGTVSPILRGLGDIARIRGTARTPDRRSAFDLSSAGPGLDSSRTLPPSRQRA